MANILTRNPKFNRSHLLALTNQHTKLEDPWAVSSLVIDQTKFVYGLTDGQTNMCKAIYALFFERGHTYLTLYILETT